MNHPGHVMYYQITISFVRFRVVQIIKLEEKLDQIKEKKEFPMDLCPEDSFRKKIQRDGCEFISNGQDAVKDNKFFDKAFKDCT